MWTADQKLKKGHMFNKYSPNKRYLYINVKALISNDLTRAMINNASEKNLLRP